MSEPRATPAYIYMPSGAAFTTFICISLNICTTSLSNQIPAVNCIFGPPSIGHPVRLQVPFVIFLCRGAMRAQKSTQASEHTSRPERFIHTMQVRGGCVAFSGVAVSTCLE